MDTPHIERALDSAEPSEFVVVLLPGFSQLCLSALIEPLQLANSISERVLFRWRLASADGRSVESASGISIEVSHAFFADSGSTCAGRFGGVVICAGEGVERFDAGSLRSFIRAHARQGVPIYALGTATWLLADAALLADARCTIHWTKMAALSETFSELSIDDALFVADGQFVTCAGQFAAFDLAMQLVRERCGEELVHDICRHVTADCWREGASSQSRYSRLAAAGTRLLDVIQLMETHIEDPLPLEAIARRTALSRRQIERLFERYINDTPLQYYHGLRLNKARQLLESTGLSVTDVAVASGFVSLSHFSRSFKQKFNVLPSGFRKAAASRTTAGFRGFVSPQTNTSWPKGDGYRPRAPKASGADDIRRKAIGQFV